MVGCCACRDQSAEEVQSFYLDEMVELLGHYLRSDQARSLADPIELTDGMGNRTISLVRGCLPA